MKLLDLFIASSIPVVKVLLITGLGFFLAQDTVGILGQDARKHLNNVVFFVFNPALVSSNLAQTITYESMMKLWFMPFNILFTFIIGTLLGWIVVQFTKPPSHLRGLILGCCAAGNLGNLPLIIIPAVCKEKRSPFGDPDACEKYGLAYVSLSMAVGAIYLWSYVYNLVRIYSRGKMDSGTSNPSNSKLSAQTNHEICTEPLLSSKECLISKDHEEACALPSTRYDGRAEAGTWNKIKQRLGWFSAKVNLKTIFAPSTTGAIVGFMIALIPQMRKLMIGSEAPLRVIQDSVSLVGDGAIPSVTLIIGGNLLKGLRGPGIQKSIVFGIVVARYLMLPIIGVLVVRGAYHLGLVSSEPLYQFVLLLQFAVPPAMNIGTITQLFGAGESECSVILLWTYALASVALTLWPTFFMWLLS